MTSDALITVRRRMRTQGLTGDGFPTPAAAVSFLGAVQSQVHGEAKWSICERVRGCTDADVEDAFARGELLRTHVLRPTWHFVCPEDIRWMLTLTAPRVHQANAFYYRQQELDQETIARGQAAILAAVSDAEPPTRKELSQALLAAGIEGDPLRHTLLVMHAELEQVICSGPRRGKQHTYALLDDRAPAAAALSPPDPAVELARRYFTSHAPATLKDFVWWSGLTVTDARAAHEAVATELEEGRTPRASGEAVLVPSFDELTVGYKGLRYAFGAVTPAEELRNASVVVIDGAAVGLWRRTRSAHKVTVDVSLFAELDGPAVDALHAAADRYGAHVGLPVTLRAEVGESLASPE